ncbi:chaplin [Streptomyces chumphonensis]|uniref:chaplin n=1 Tax=Streptomyces chumphonensis TaxID=1214925 RepID=UPI002963DD79|nr:chaplin [Streptomyces chumphonensis]
MPEAASGTVVRVPVHVPANPCGDTVDVVGPLDPTFGTFCLNACPRGLHRPPLPASGHAPGGRSPVRSLVRTGGGARAPVSHTARCRCSACGSAA